VAFSVVLLAACTSTVPGVAVKDRTVQPGEVIAALLDPGSYPTRPRPALGTAGVDGPIVEGQRMAEFVVGPWEVDPGLRNLNPIGTLVYKNAESLGVSLLAPAPAIAAAHQFLVGFSSDRFFEGPTGQSRALRNAVLRFATHQAAGAAATELSTVLDSPGGTGPRQRFAVPGHPEARAQTFTLGDGTTVVESYTPHGPYVLYNLARAADGNPDAAAQLIGRALDLQHPRIDEFVPTDPAAFAELPVDPTGLLARALPVPAGQLNIAHGAWQPRAALHYQRDPPLSATLFDQAAVLTVAHAMVTVYETRDPAGAQRLLDGFLAEAAADNPDRKPVPGVPGLPTAKCFDNGQASYDSPPFAQPRFDCRYAVEHYMVSITATRDVEAQQRAAAQYLMLTAP
jgi:hypothetical protein